jgi:hypothetical protein
MIEKIQVELNRCTCSCGHSWISEEIPKRCAGCRSRNWNSDNDKTIPIEEEVKRIALETEPDLDPFAESNLPVPKKPVLEKPKSSGSKIAEALLAQMASKLGRPSHAINCTCYTCKPPKAVK